jgi:AMP-polyphosphate phosphotransferase
MGRLDHLDLTAKISREEYDERLYTAQRRLLALRLQLGGLLPGSELGPGVLVVMEGSDAGGKGGAIKRIVEPLDPRHYRVSAFAKPTFDEKSKHFLWRFWKEVPGLGGMALFDRSWYGRVLVERVEGYAKESEWRRAYEEIRDFEELLCEHGIVLVKFWLQIDRDEQARRFAAREKVPYKQYKITEEDYRNRGKWEHYEAAVHDMVEQTSGLQTPWTLVEANDKYFARIKVLRTICDRLQAAVERKK